MGKFCDIIHVSQTKTSVFPSFDASLHNNYVRNKIRNNDRLRQERQEEEEKVQSELEQIDMVETN